jgi:dynein heavy chain, axonemal
LNERFLEDVNNTLNSGEIPNLWLPDEKEVILNEMRPINDQLKRPSDSDTIYKTFVERVRNNLHIVLCMSPIGDALRVRCRNFPSLVDCCAIDWFASWPEEALISVASRIFKEDTTFPNPTSLPLEELIDSLSNMC